MIISSNIQTTLLILLAAGYLVLLLAAIVAVVIIIKILQSLRNIAKKAEATTDNISELLKSLGKRAAPAIFSTVLAAIMKKVKDRRKSGDKDNEDD